MNQKAQIIALARERAIIRPSDLVAAGLKPEYLRQLVEEGQMIKSARGLYTLANFEVSEAHSLVEAVRAQSKGVICLLSALNFHDLGTQLPHQVWIGVPYGSWISHRDLVPVRVVVMRSAGYETGIETHRLEGTDVPVYNIPKTIADCFKFRSKIGLDIGLEALREALSEQRCTREEIRKYAKIIRVEKVMRPYMEAMAF
jgi:predicted transcriptional regulator of viral defense system